MLVKQFSGKFDFIRELVQNSLDSGTATVAVWTDYRQLSRGGVAEIHVDDNGEGMDEAIIDGSLTKLFSSTKEDDLTNIGKFGIGFASVFAISPDGVLVRTARGGERWEVFFDTDRSFEKTRLTELFEGTKITVFKQLERRAYPEMVQNIRAMLAYWCKHAEKRIVFFDRTADESVEIPVPIGRKARRESSQGEVINAPFTVDGDFPVLVQTGQARIAMAFSEKPFFGFYNHGLTIKETDTFELFGWSSPYFANVAFKIKSAYLEHTLTRDTLLMDANFEKVLLLLVNCAREDLVEKLLSKLEAWAAEKTLSEAARAEYVKGLEWLYRLQWELDPTFGFSERLKDVSFNTDENMRRTFAAMFAKQREKRGRQRSVEASGRKIFRQSFGGPVTIEQIRKSARAAENRVILSPAEDSMTQELCGYGHDVFISAPSDAAKRFFMRHVTKKAEGNDAENRGEIPSIIGVGEGVWLLEPVDRAALPKEARSLFQFIETLGATVALSLVPVNFLGDDPARYVLGARMLKGGRSAALGPGGEGAAKRPVAIDVFGSLFHKLTAMFGTDEYRDTAMLIVARELAACASLGAVDRLMLFQFAEVRLS